MKITLSFEVVEGQILLQVVLATDDDTADSSCAVTVKLPALVITKGLEDQEAKVGDKVLLNVEVSAPPKSIKWYGLIFIFEFFVQTVQLLF